MRSRRQPTVLQVNGMAVKVAAVVAAVLLGLVVAIDAVCAGVAQVLYGLGVG
jgi:hypothetical protein